MSKFFKNAKNKFKLGKEEPKAPRAMAEINKDYTAALARSGQAAYLVFVHGKDLEYNNQLMLSLNQEGQARQNLDKAAAAEQAAKSAKPLEQGATSEQA